jgi:hypothetical protein
MHTNKKNSMNVLIAGTASRIKTKQNVTRILSIFVVIPGHVPHSQVMLPRFTTLRQGQTKLTPADIVARTSLALVYLLRLCLAHPLR